MDTSANNGKLRIAILQRVCPSYRVALFRQFSEKQDIDFQLFIGDDIPDTKVKSAIDLDSIKHIKLRTRFIKIGRRVFPWHVNLVDELRLFAPDVILCEGESHFLGYLQAICYKLFFNNKVGLMHWCFISLPGELHRLKSITFKIKRFFSRFFDAFVVYSSYSKQRLIELGHSQEKIFVATNVGDVQKFLHMSAVLTESKSEARLKLKLLERFTVLYSGTLDDNKRPDMLLDLADVCDRNKFNFVLLGNGVLLDTLQRRASYEKLTNVFLPGRVTKDLLLYYRAADVLLIPGRGGIVMSEALAFGVPVIVYQADGTEYDLIINEITGLHVLSDSINDFKRALIWLQENPQKCSDMGLNGRKLIINHYTTQNMVKSIIDAAHYTQKMRAKVNKSH